MKFDLSPRQMFGAILLASAGVLLTGCNDPSEQEKAEAIATTLYNKNKAEERLIAYANYDYRSGKTTRLERHATLVADIAGCAAHGEYHAMRSDSFAGGRDVALSCLKTDGQLIAQFNCKVSDTDIASCTRVGFDGAPEKAPNGPKQIRFPSLD